MIFSINPIKASPPHALQIHVQNGQMLNYASELNSDLDEQTTNIVWWLLHETINNLVP